jgi:hypothetical protein
MKSIQDCLSKRYGGFSYATLTAIVVFLLMALLRESLMQFNPDNVFLLYAARRFLGGDRLYVDILEINPPLIIYLNCIPVTLARLLHSDLIATFIGVVSLVNLLSLYVVAGILRTSDLSELLADSLLGFFGFGLLMMPVLLYGEREHLWIALILPYLVQSMHHARSRHPILVALLAALGFAIKPFFLIVWGANMLFQAVEERSIRSVFSSTNLSRFMCSPRTTSRRSRRSGCTPILPTTLMSLPSSVEPDVSSFLYFCCYCWRGRREPLHALRRGC